MEEIDYKLPEDIIIYEGKIEVLNIKNEFIEGKIIYKWLPKPEVIIEVNKQKLDIEPTCNIFNNMEIDIKIGDQEFKQVRLNHLKYQDNEKEICFRGNFNRKLLLNSDLIMEKLDDEIEIDYITFEVPNFVLSFFENNEELVLECKNYEINLKKIEEYIPNIRQLKNYGTYQKTHNGSIKKKNNKKMKISEVEEVIDTLNSFFCFLNCSLTACINIKGYIKNEEIFVCYSTSRINAFKYLIKWTDKIEDSENYNKLWSKFKEKHKEEEFRILLNRYNAILNNSVPVEPSIVIEQSIIEMIYFINCKKDSGYPEKLRKVLCCYNIDFNELNKNNEIINCTLKDKTLGCEIDSYYELFGFIRNAYTHPNNKKMEKIEKIDKEIYVEIYLAYKSIILRIILIELKYQGKYWDYNSR